MKLKYIILGARWMALLAAVGGVGCVIWMARNCPQALVAGACVWAMGNLALLIAQRRLDCWRAMQRARRRKL